MNNEVITVRAKDIHEVRKLETVSIEISTLLAYFKRRKEEIASIPLNDIVNLSEEQIKYFTEIRDVVFNAVNVLDLMDRQSLIAQYANIFDSLYRNQDIMEEQKNGQENH